MKKKLISILTSTKNVESTLEATLKSIYSQTFTNFEHLIKDAESSDNTMKILSLYKDRISYLESSPDKGIYDALNLLSQKANSEWCLVIHAGDILYSPTVLEEVVPYLTNEVDIVYGTVVNIHETGAKQIKLPYPPSHLHFGMIGSHQAMFVRTELLKSIPYDLQWKIAADYDFIWKCYRSNKRFKRIDTTVAIVSGTGLSSKRILNNRKEKLRIANSYDNNLFYTMGRYLQYTLLRLRLLIKPFLPNGVLNKIALWKK